MSAFIMVGLMVAVGTIMVVWTLVDRALDRRASDSEWFSLLHAVNSGRSDFDIDLAGDCAFCNEYVDATSGSYINGSLVCDDCDSPSEWSNGRSSWN